MVSTAERRLQQNVVSLCVSVCLSRHLYACFSVYTYVCRVYIRFCVCVSTKAELYSMLVYAVFSYQLHVSPVANAVHVFQPVALAHHE